MRRTKPTRIGELLNDFMDKSPRVARKMAEARVVDAWPIVVGIHAANHTKSVEVKNGVLTATMTSSVVRHEIFMQRNSLRDAINKELGVRVVNVVIVK